MKAAKQGAKKTQQMVAKKGWARVSSSGTNQEDTENEQAAMLQSTHKLSAIIEVGTTRIAHGPRNVVPADRFRQCIAWSPGRAVHVPPSRQARSPDPGAVGFAKWLEAVERALRD